ncbi:zinc dependent phospholipase C family protein [Acetivibrio mesophilus]|uniref:Phospholipase C n=1 Tax=Acetivibrio mesophilus TaxID=2487273 RepID=A0A4Q0I1Q6_9FIRM|nr:zinc dependent phospholipase C family protein [Acetivibrio mesophilus]ODM24778.1 phospholipase [Clostridium sp. Bc-iso-3]RXE58071.1 phospholipase [Acetivibrio mesophilus]
MAGRLERTYGRAFKYFLFAINPFKKAVIKTECVVHKYINIQALEILKNDKYIDAHCLFSDYIDDLNQGVTWADQDLKSANHFYNPYRKKGLYGNNNALTLAVSYYENALKYWYDAEPNLAMFYLGAAIHLVQDMTIPHHANIRLLDNHRQYENYIKRTYLNTPRYTVDRGGYYLSNIEEYITCNARNAIKIYSRLKDIKDVSKRFHVITKFTLPLAQKTTAGCYLTFYRDIAKRFANSTK